MSIRAEPIKSKAIRQAARSEEIDFIKGALVVLMVVYHATSAFRRADDGTGWGKTITTQLIFLHSAFVGIAGFLCGYYYYPKYRVQPGKIRRRLIERGIKLYVIMVLANACIYALGFGYSIAKFHNQVNSIHAAISKLILSPSGSLLAFEILTYIALLLLVIAFVIRPGLAAVACGGLLILNAFVNWTLLNFLIVGLVCHLFGIWISTGAQNFPFKIHRLGHGWLAILIFVLSRFFMPGLYAASGGRNLHVLIVLLDTVFWFGGILACSHWIRRSAVRSMVIFLGQYTLLAYILQMALIHGIQAVIGDRLHSAWLLYMTLVLGSLVLLYVVLQTIHQMRSKSLIVDRMYRFSFQ
jgi:hypothetical protein